MPLNLFVCFDLLTKSCFTAYISGGNEQVPPIFCWRLRSLQSSWVKVGCGPLSNPHLTHGFIFIYFFKPEHLYTAFILSSPRMSTLWNGGAGNSSVGRASDWKARRSTDAGSSPRWGQRFFSQSQLPVQTLTVPVQPPCAIACINICTLVKNSTHWQPYHCFGHTKILHTLAEIGSAVRAAAVPYLGKATRISRNGQSSTKNKQTNKQQQQ